MFKYLVQYIKITSDQFKSIQKQVKAVLNKVEFQEGCNNNKINHVNQYNLVQLGTTYRWYYSLLIPPIQ
jgi:hypothetical protein